VSPIDSRFSFPPLVASTKSEGTSLAPISNVVGSFSLGASSLVVACSVLQSFSDVLPLQVSSCITSS
jgi:hypothetical protein